MAEQICQHVSGFPNWLITKHQQSYLEAFESCTKDLVYLTAGMHSSYSVISCYCLSKTSLRPSIPRCLPRAE